MDPLQAELLKDLWDKKVIHIVRETPRIRLDFRPAWSFRDEPVTGYSDKQVSAMAKLMWPLVESLPHEGIVGIPNAGTDVALQIWLRARECGTDLPLLTINKHTGQITNLGLRPGSKVIQVDDLATYGTHGANIATLLRKEGYMVEHHVVFLDRMLGAPARLRAARVRSHCVVKMDQAIRFFCDIGEITQEDCDAAFAELIRD